MTAKHCVVDIKMCVCVCVGDGQKPQSELALISIMRGVTATGNQHIRAEWKRKLPGSYLDTSVFSEPAVTCHDQTPNLIIH